MLKIATATHIIMQLLLPAIVNAYAFSQDIYPSFPAKISQWDGSAHFEGSFDINGRLPSNYTINSAYVTLKLIDDSYDPYTSYNNSHAIIDTINKIIFNYTESYKVYENESVSIVIGNSDKSQQVNSYSSDKASLGPVLYNKSKYEYVSVNNTVSLYNIKYYNQDITFYQEPSWYTTMLLNNHSLSDLTSDGVLQFGIYSQSHDFLFEKATLMLDYTEILPTSVPEPSTFLLIGASLIGMIVWSYKKRPV